MVDALVIGRFQVMGNHHCDLFKYIKEKEDFYSIDRLLVGIGVADYVDSKNIYNSNEVEQMLKPILDKIKMDYVIRVIHDINDVENYATHVQSIFEYNPKETVLFSENELTLECFESEMQIDRIEPRVQQHSSEIRYNIAHSLPWKHMVPESTVEFLRKEGKLSRLFREYYKNPLPAVDAVALYDNQVVLVKRKDGRGLALPGGFWEAGETPESAAARELEEETGLDFEIYGQLPVRGNPGRDPRRHILTVPFYGIATGVPVAGDDAEEVIMMDLEAAVANVNFADHVEIIRSYINREVKEYVGSMDQVSPDGS